MDNTIKQTSYLKAHKDATFCCTFMCTYNYLYFSYPLQ